MGISGKDWIRLQQRHRRGDEEYVSVTWMDNCASLLENRGRGGNMASRSAHSVSEQSMQWAADARHVVYCNALHCPTLYCTVLLRGTWETT